MEEYKTISYGSFYVQIWKISSIWKIIVSALYLLKKCLFIYFIYPRIYAYTRTYIHICIFIYTCIAFYSWYFLFFIFKFLSLSLFFLLHYRVNAGGICVSVCMYVCLFICYFISFVRSKLRIYQKLFGERQRLILNGATIDALQKLSYNRMQKTHMLGTAYWKAINAKMTNHFWYTFEGFTKLA